jgi:hypothetical protein
MAVINPDYKLDKASKYIKNLGDSDEDELIKYYIEKKNEIIIYKWNFIIRVIFQKPNHL